jgi:hypothetical protein
LKKTGIRGERSLLRAAHDAANYYGKGGGSKSGKKGKKSAGIQYPQIDPNPCGCAEGQFFDFLDWGESGCDGGECLNCTEIYTFIGDGYLEPAPYFCDFYETNYTMSGNTTFLPFGGRQDCRDKCFLALENVDANGCDPYYEFFNYDDFEFGFSFGGSCEACENFANAEACAHDGLPRGGEVECLERCFSIY